MTFDGWMTVSEFRFWCQMLAVAGRRRIIEKLPFRFWCEARLVSGKSGVSLFPIAFKDIETVLTFL